MKQSREAAPSSPLTRNQRLVLDVIREAARPIGAYEILHKLGAAGLRSPIQVYRATDRLVSVGEIHRVGKLAAFVACSHPHAPKHQLAVLCICDQCGGVTEFHGGDVEHSVRELAHQMRLTLTDASIELNVLCDGCAAQRRNQLIATV